MTRAEETSYVNGPGSVRGAHCTHGSAGRQRSRRLSSAGVWTGHPRIRVPRARSTGVAGAVRDSPREHRVSAGNRSEAVVSGQWAFVARVALHVGQVGAAGRRAADAGNGSRAV